MKNTFETENDSRRGLAWEIMRVSGLVAVAVLVIGVSQYAHQRPAAPNVQELAETTEKLREAGQLDHLIHLLNVGKTNEARALMGEQLAGDLTDLSFTLAAADDQTRQTGRGVCSQILNEEKTHPEYYLPGEAAGREFRAAAWQKINGSAFNPALTN